MRRTIAAVLALLVTACSGGGGSAETDPFGNSHTYELVPPPALDPARPAPLLLFLHGYGPSNGDPLGNYPEWLQLREAAAARGVILALPIGTWDFTGSYFWNGAGCCNFYGSDVDDVAFLTSVIDDAAARFPVDASRVFVMGHSGGAFMAHRMGCDAAGRVTGIVGFAGSVWSDPDRCRPSAPVAALQLHGDADEAVLYDGQVVNGLRWPSAPESVGVWGRVNGCTGALHDTGRRLDLAPDLDGAETRVSAFDCQAGAAELWTIAGGQHAPALREPDATLALIDWLVAHPRPAPEAG